MPFPPKRVVNSDPGTSDLAGGNDWDDLVDLVTYSQRAYTSLVFKSGSTHYAIKYDGSIISSGSVAETVLAAALALKGTVLLTGHNSTAPDSFTLSGAFTGFDMLADTCLIIDKSCNLFVPNAYTGYVFRDHDQGYLSIIMYGQVNEAGSPARDWTFLKLLSDNAGSGCIDTYLQGFGGQINNALCGIELNSTGSGFVNGNTFTGIFMDGVEIGVKCVSTSSGPIHHNVFQNILIEGENGGAVREGFKDITGNDNSFINCHTIDFVSTDTAWKFNSTSRGNNLINCATDDGKFIDLGTQNTVTNCKLAATNYAMSSFYTRPDVAKIGMWHGLSNAQEADGFINSRISTSVVGTGAKSNVIDSTGCYMLMDTGATINSIFGHRLSVTALERINNAYFKTAIYPTQNTACRIYAGFSSNSGAAASTADPLNGVSGVGLWFDSAVSANWKRGHNDGAGAGVYDDTGVSVSATTLYPIEIFAVSDNKFRFVFNGTATDISSDIPGSTTNLGFHIYIENTTGASKTCRVYYYILRTDK